MCFKGQNHEPTEFFQSVLIARLEHKRSHIAKIQVHTIGFYIRKYYTNYWKIFTYKKFIYLLIQPKWYVRKFLLGPAEWN